jgi:hypothetical protein
VVDEVEDLVKIHGVKLILFADDSFVLPYPAGSAHARHIAAEILRRGLTLDFRCFANVDSFADNWDLLDLLTQAGMESAFVGFESASPERQRQFRKVQDRELECRLVAACDRRGIVVIPGFIKFTPYTMPEELELNAEFLRDAGLSHFFRNFARCFRVYPGIEILENMRKDKLLETGDRSYQRLYGYRYMDPQVGALSRTLQVLRKCMIPIDRVVYTCLHIHGKLVRCELQCPDKYGVLRRRFSRILGSSRTNNEEAFLALLNLIGSPSDEHAMHEAAAPFLAQANRIGRDMIAWAQSVWSNIEDEDGSPWLREFASQALSDLLSRPYQTCTPDTPQYDAWEPYEEPDRMLRRPDSWHPSSRERPATVAVTTC